MVSNHGCFRATQHRPLAVMRFGTMCHSVRGYEIEEGKDRNGQRFFTSDIHFSHGGTIRTFKRPFSSIEEMDEILIERWNKVVLPRDKVFVLGDFTVYNRSYPVIPLPIFQRLNGHKYLIVGNHDKGATLKLGWGWVKREGFLKGLNPSGIWLGHIPRKVWRDSVQGSWHLFGHRHGNYPPHGLSFDVGVDCWDFTPIEFQRVRLKMASLACMDAPPEYREGSKPKEDKIDQERLQRYRKILSEGRIFIAKKDGRYRVEYDGNYHSVTALVHQLAHPDEESLGEDEQIHHRDGDRLNDHPDNLQRISRKEHEALHRAQGVVSVWLPRKLWLSLTRRMHIRRIIREVTANTEISTATK